jgi:5-methylcytosine-specific restriction endonuclease McrA
VTSANALAVRRYRARHPDRVKATQRKWKKANRERVLELQKEWRQRHLEVCREKDRNRPRRGTPAQIAAWTRRYKEKHPERMRQRKRAHYHRLATKDPRVKAVYFIMRWLRDQGDDVHVDHVIPLAKGGPHTYENLQILPALANKRKGTKLPCCI